MPAAISEAVSIRPAGPLSLVVVQHQGYRQRHVPPARHLGLPSPYLTMIVTIDEPLTLSGRVDRSEPPRQYRSLLAGLHTSPVVVEHAGAQSGIQLQLSPLGARPLLGLPAGELAGLDVSAQSLLGQLALDVQQQVQSAVTWPDRFAVLDQVLGRRLDGRARPPAEVCRAWHLLLASRGAMSVAAVAKDVGWSERHLARGFRREIGLTPKTAARVIRFDWARRRLEASGQASVAAAAGYYDQSHLIRNFTAFTGVSPQAWLAAEVGNVQYTAPNAGSD